jgi:hypothetical protein
MAQSLPHRATRLTTVLTTLVLAGLTSDRAW